MAIIILAYRSSISEEFGLYANECFGGFITQEINEIDLNENIVIEIQRSSLEVS